MTNLEPTQRERMEGLLVDEIRRGASVRTTAKRYRLTISAVRLVCRDHGLSVPRDGSDRVYAIIARLMNTDDSLVQVAEATGVSKVYVHRIYQRCRSAGVPIKERPRGRPRSKSEVG